MRVYSNFAQSFYRYSKAQLLKLAFLLTIIYQIILIFNIDLHVAFIFIIRSIENQPHLTFLSSFLHLLNSGLSMLPPFTFLRLIHIVCPEGSCTTYYDISILNILIVTLGLAVMIILFFHCSVYYPKISKVNSFYFPINFTRYSSTYLFMVSIHLFQMSWLGYYLRRRITHISVYRQNIR